MSEVTNIILNIEYWILNFGLIDSKKISEVNCFFEREDLGFVSVDAETLPTVWYGGTKRFEAELYLGAFNNINLKKLISHLKGIQWKSPNCVQLIVMEQNDSKFRIIEITRDP